MSEVTQGSTVARVESLMSSARHGNIKLARLCIEEGVDINAFEPGTGLTALHLAVGMNNLEIVRFLLENGASVIPDKRGRWPSTIAELCEVDDELGDLIVDAESALGDV